MPAAPALTWQEGAGFRFADLAAPTEGHPGFALLPPEATGVTFSNRLADATVAVNRLYEIGSGVALGDVDGDSRVDEETSRHDAGIGLILLGDGRGNFRPLGPREAGFSIYGEQRGSAVADFDGDGRVDLVVAQHGGPTRLLRNTAGQPGVRLTLRGASANPQAIGTTVRLQFGERLGPVREVRAGNGYWSQDAATQVLAAPSAPTAVEVRWPHGETRRWPWPKGARWVEVSAEGLQVRAIGDPGRKR